MKKIFSISILFLSALSSCQEKTSPAVADFQRLQQQYKVAYFASGCFWCVEAIFESVKGVKEAVSGYSGGQDQSPTYQEVSSGRTGHAETVAVFYNSKEINYTTLLRVFFGSHDPTTLNRQGPDRGSQYRSVVFYTQPEEKQQAEAYMAQLTRNKVFQNPIVTEVVPFEKFYIAEDYHQNYERNHPDNPYIQNVSLPRLRSFQSRFPELLKPSHH